MTPALRALTLVLPVALAATLAACSSPTASGRSSSTTPDGPGAATPPADGQRMGWILTDSQDGLIFDLGFETPWGQLNNTRYRGGGPFTWTFDANGQPTGGSGTGWFETKTPDGNYTDGAVSVHFTMDRSVPEPANCLVSEQQGRYHYS